MSGSRVLVLGSTGMLGQALMLETRMRGHEVVGAARQGAEIVCDLSDPDSCRNAFLKARQDLVINAAAITDFSLCERDPALAGAVNGVAPGTLARLSQQTNSRLIHVSTDHFFLDDGPKAHLECDPVTLVNNYARSKFAGEMNALKAPKSLVLRTNVVGLKGLRNQPSFANWVFDVVEGRVDATLFDDYFTSSIGVKAFSSFLFDAIEAGATGLLNLAAREVSSKFRFVEAVASATGSPLKNVKRLSVRSLPVARANSCGLDVSLAESLLGKRMPTLDEVVADLVIEKRMGNSGL